MIKVDENSEEASNMEVDIIKTLKMACLTDCENAIKEYVWLW